MGKHLTIKQKYEIILYRSKHPKATYNSMKIVFEAKFKQTIGFSTFRNIFQNSETISFNALNLEKKDSKKPTKGKFNEVEDALKIWIDTQESRNNPVTDELIRQKAEIFAGTLGITDFKLSNGTLARFKERKGFKCFKSVGEMAEVSASDYETAIHEIKETMKEYRKNDIFNMDETGLYYRLIPSKSISKNPIKGFKKLLSRITLAFTVSMTGEKLKPLVIGSSAKPRALIGFKTSKYVDYAHSKKSWMTSSIFNIYLNNLNSIMSVQNRKILLLVDNCPAHKITSEYSNVKVVFLPPNTTGVLQPLDLGIIRSFKCKFRINLTRHAVHLIDTTNCTTLEAYKFINIRDAVMFTWFAWGDVESSTIKNCFKKSPLFSVGKEENGDTMNINLEEKKEMEGLLLKLKLEEPVTVSNVVDVEEEDVVVCDIEDSVIIEMIKLHDDNEDSGEEEEIGPQIKEVIEISANHISSAIENVNNTFDILKNDKNVTTEALKAIKVLQTYLYKRKSETLKNGDMLKWLIRK